MKVLIVEDNESIQELIALTLERENFTVDFAKDGIMGVTKAQENDYDVIILDMILPKLNGFNVIAGLRALKNNVPILAISSNSDVNARIKAIDLGADDFLVKDFSFEELISRVKRLVRRNSKGRQSNIFECGGLVINYSTVTVTYKNNPIKLAKKEFQMLLLLLQNKGRVVSRKEFAGTIWREADGRFPSNTIDVHMQSLRKKLQEAQKLIHTVHGTGFMIKPD